MYHNTLNRSAACRISRRSERSGSREGITASKPPQNEVGGGRGPIAGPFSSAPAQTVQARFRAHSFPEGTHPSVGNKQGLMHCAALQPWQFRRVPPAALCPVLKVN